LLISAIVTIVDITNSNCWYQQLELVMSLFIIIIAYYYLHYLQFTIYSSN